MSQDLTVKELIDFLKEVNQEYSIYRHDSEWNDIPIQDVEVKEGYVVIS